MCRRLSTDDAYHEAMSLQRYGHPFIIANAFRDKLETWPNIQSMDPKSIRSYESYELDFNEQHDTSKIKNHKAMYTGYGGNG